MPKPPSRKPNTKASSPTAAESDSNLEKTPTDARVYMQVKIPSEMKKAFQIYAVEQDLDLSGLFERVWAYYEENHP